MTTNQTIDGVLVSRELLPCPLCGSDKVSLAWDVYDTDRGRRTQSQIQCLGCRILTKTFKSHAEARAYWNNRASQPQGEPVAEYDALFIAIGDAVTVKSMGHISISVKAFKERMLRCGLAITSAEQQGFGAILSGKLAGHDAVAIGNRRYRRGLLGEFKLLVTKECPECCELEEPVEGCSICDGEGEYGQKHTIPWDQIKFIYSKAVSGLAMKAESAKT